MNVRVLLASSSPRRRELLKNLFSDFDVRGFAADEHFIGETPEETVAEISRRKLAAASELFGSYDIVIACDTLVYMDGRYYGKPSDEADAVRMLKELSGRTHTVYSGVSLFRGGACVTEVVRSEVTFRKMSDEDIKNYVASHSVTDKAGAYAVQDGVVVERYEGSYSNIVGLPLEALGTMI